MHLAELLQEDEPSLLILADDGRVFQARKAEVVWSAIDGTLDRHLDPDKHEKYVRYVRGEDVWSTLEAARRFLTGKAAALPDR